jgi:hypothetical protein
MFTDLVKIALCFIAICYGWLFFRAPSLDKIVSLTSTLIFDFGNMDLGVAWPKMAAVLGLPIFFMLEFIERAGGEKAFYKALPVPIWTALYAVIIFCLAIGLTTESTQFIYMVF